MLKASHSWRALVRGVVDSLCTHPAPSRCFLMRTVAAVACSITCFILIGRISVWAEYDPKPKLECISARKACRRERRGELTSVDSHFGGMAIGGVARPPRAGQPFWLYPTGTDPCAGMGTPISCFGGPVLSWGCGCTCDCVCAWKCGCTCGDPCTGGHICICGCGCICGYADCSDRASSCGDPYSCPTACGCDCDGRIGGQPGRW